MWPIVFIEGLGGNRCVTVLWRLLGCWELLVTGLDVFPANCTYREIQKSQKLRRDKKNNTRVYIYTYLYFPEKRFFFSERLEKSAVFISPPPLAAPFENSPFSMCANAYIPWMFGENTTSFKSIPGQYFLMYNGFKKHRAQ